MDVYGLIGDPVEHSLSPVMFEAAFDAAGIDARYVTFRVDPSALESAITGAAALDIAGLNVTIPHKSAVLELSTPSPAAEAIGAANVLSFDDEVPAATNTDVTAMASVLDGLERGPDHALVLGAGGAARAYVHALATAGWRIDIVNRTPERAITLASRYDKATGHPAAAAIELAENAELILNTTPVGLDGEDSPIDPAAITRDHVVVDAVYRPGDTPLIETAAKRGAETIAGDTLLLEQAVATFERWRSVPAPRAAMEAKLERAMTR